MTAIQRAWTWWTGELSDMFDGHDQRPDLALELVSDEVILVNRKSGRRLADAKVDAPDWPERLEAMREIAVRLDRDPPAVEMALPREQTLFSKEVFSLEAAQDLRAAGAERAAQLTGQKEELAVDVSPPRLPEPDGAVTAVVAVTPQQTVDEAKDYAARWGFDLARLTAAEQSADFPEGPTFYQNLRRDRGSKFLKRASFVLLLAVVGGLGVASWRALEARTALAEASLRDLDGGADRLRAARDRADALETFSRDAGRPTWLRRSAPPMWRLAAELPAALPDGVWLDSIRISEGALRVQGRAAALDGVMRGLDDSRYFGAARRRRVETAQGGGAVFVIDATIDNPGEF